MNRVWAVGWCILSASDIGIDKKEEMMPPSLRFPQSQIEFYANEYNYSKDDNELIRRAPQVRRRGYLRKSELEKIAHWKAPRSARHVLKNSNDYVVEVTRFALATSCERAKIESLTILNGVDWPTASVILHFFHNDPYPILDFRALWSISLSAPSQYSYDFWWKYVKFCRRIANHAGVGMRMLDKALWQYSKENQYISYNH